MAHLHIPSENRTLAAPQEIAAYLAQSGSGVTFERWEAQTELRPDAPPEDILSAYAADIERLKRRGGYVTSDVIALDPETPNLEQILTRFQAEHWHNEDEVRFVIAGSGVFFVRPASGSVFSVEVGPGDLLCVPRGTHHWFTLCKERRIRCIRLFQDAAGWTPFYTHSGVDALHQPLCFGTSYFARES